MSHPTIPIAISMGEPAGIGPEQILALYADREALGLPPFVVYGSIDFLRRRAARLGLAIGIAECTPHDAAGQFAETLPVANIEGLVSDRPGEPNTIAASVVIDSIARATRAVLQGECRALVTAPIHKAVLHGAGFSHPGHTEYLASLCNTSTRTHHPVMMMAHGDLRVVPLTIHVPLRKVPELVTAPLLVTTLRTLAHDLRTRFGIAEPRLGVTGLNPHAGERGSMGSEELDIIGPTLTGLRQEGMNVEGPIPADTIFHLPHWRKFDAVVAMYHDQALIPIKTVAFDSAVNVTLGLPLVRTSPDHGTAFDLAGTGKASTASFLAALRLADTLTGADA